MPLALLAILKTLFILFIICCTVVAISNFINSGTMVVGYSMTPTLNNYEDENIHDYVYVNRFAKYTYGDLIVVNNPQDNDSGRNVIKRVIALGNDKIAIVRTDTSSAPQEKGFYKIVLIKNGGEKEFLQEDYIDENQSLYPAYLEFQNLIAKKNLQGAEVEKIDGISFLKIQEGYIFFMGDNRGNSGTSVDCLDYGPVLANKVVGKVNIIVYQNKNHITYIFDYYVKKIFG